MLQKDYTVQDCVKSLVTRLIFGSIELKPTWDFEKSLMIIDRGSTGSGVQMTPTFSSGESKNTV